MMLGLSSCAERPTKHLAFGQCGSSAAESRGWLGHIQSVLHVVDEDGLEPSVCLDRGENRDRVGR